MSANKKNRIHSVKNRICTKTEFEKFDYTFDLFRNEILQIGSDVQLVFLGTHFAWGEQARFAIRAPDEVSILRLELFSNRFQDYQQEFTVSFGDRMKIGEDVQLCVLPVPGDNSNGQVYLNVVTKNNTNIKKSFFNKLD